MVHVLCKRNMLRKKSLARYHDDMGEENAVVPKRKFTTEKGGRPRVEVNPEVIRALATKGAAKAEIARYCGISVDTLDRRFAEVVDNGYNERKLKLRDLQFKSAEAGNVVMQIFLGKNELGQRDRFDDEVASNNISINILELPKGS
jgi:hypothetical protein